MYDKKQDYPESVTGFPCYRENPSFNTSLSSVPPFGIAVCPLSRMHRLLIALKLSKKLAKNMLNIHNQLCLALLETPPCATSI